MIHVAPVFTQWCQCGVSATGERQQFIDYGWTQSTLLSRWLCPSCSAKEVTGAPSPSTVHAGETSVETVERLAAQKPAPPAIDREFVVLAEVVDLLNPLNPAAIERIIGYLKSRYL